MANNPASYLLLLVIVLAAIFAIYYITTHLFKNILPSPTVKPTTTVQLNTTGSGSNQSINGTSGNTTATGPVAGSCMTRLPYLPIRNGNFSTGTYEGWNTTGNGFGAVPFNISFANVYGYYYAAPWANYSGSFVATTYKIGTEVSPGNITSDQFKVTEPYLNFKLISPQDGYLYVEILENGRPFMINHYDTFAAAGNYNPQTNFINISVSMAPIMCQNASVRIVSDVVNTHTSKYEYIAAGDFYLSTNAHNTAGVLVNTSII